MKFRFTDWRNLIVLSGAFWVWACQEPATEETKIEQPAAEQPKPAPPAVSTAKPIEETPVEKKEEEPKPAPVKEKQTKQPDAEPIKEKKITEKPKKQPKKEEELVVTVADRPAEPASGYPAYYRYIKNSLEYPEEAKKHNAEGQVFVEFIVRKDGSLTDVRVQPGKGIGYGCDEEAVRVVKQGEKWKPAIHKGEPVAQRVVLPIKFKLN